MDLNYKKLLENLMHELASVNSVIKTSAETLSKSAKGNMDRQAIMHHADIILENSFQFSTQLDIINYQLNPKYILEVEKFDKRNLFGKFHKAILSFRRLAKERDIKISVNGGLTTLIDSKPVIDTLPILILDNALKYSPKGCHIDIDFDEDGNRIEVEVSNTGPYLTPKEREQIFTRGCRGKEAIKTQLPGHGFGLNFVKFICDIHQAQVSVQSSDSTTKIGDIIYSEFKIRIVFPRQMKQQQ